jgi:hypothetical protein
LDADTKLIPSFLVGKRDAYHAHCFIDDLASRMANRIQVSSDQLAAYPGAIERGLGSEMDYAQLAKRERLHEVVTESGGSRFFGDEA